MLTICAVPRALKTVLEEETVLKLGVGIQGQFKPEPFMQRPFLIPE